MPWPATRPGLGLETLALRLRVQGLSLKDKIDSISEDHSESFLNPADSGIENGTGHDAGKMRHEENHKAVADPIQYRPHVRRPISCTLRRLRGLIIVLQADVLSPHWGVTNQTGHVSGTVNKGKLLESRSRFFFLSSGIGFWKANCLRYQPLK